MLNWGQDLVDNMEDKVEFILASGRASPTASLQDFMPRFGESDQTRSCNQEEEEENDAGARVCPMTHKRSNKVSDGG